MSVVSHSHGGLAAGKHAGQSQEGLIACREMSEHFRSAKRDTDDTRQTALQVRSSGQGWVGIGRSCGEDLNTGCHEKAPVRCPCSRWAQRTP